MLKQILYCPECKQELKKKFGKKWVKNEQGVRIKRQQYQCKECGRITVKPIIKEV